MKSSFCSILFAALLLCAGAVHPINGQLDTSNDPGRKAIEDQIIETADAGELPLALQMVNANIAAHPDWIRLLLIRSQIYGALKQPAQVIADYSTLITKIPAIEANFSDLARLHVWRAGEYLGVANHESALADFAKAITYGGGTYANSFTNHTREHLNKKDPATAIADHTSVIARIPANKSAPIYFSRGRLNYDYGNIDASIADYSKMMELTPGDITAPFNLGRLHTKKGDFASAAKVYTLAIQNYKGKDPRGVYEWYNFRAAAYAGAGDYVAALGDYAKSIGIYPGQQKGYLERAVLYCRRGAPAEAKKDEAAAIQMGAKVAQPCTATAQKPGDTVDVIVMPGGPAKTVPASTMTAAGWFAKGEKHLDDHDLQEAVDAFTEAIKLKADYADAYERRAVAHFAGMGHTDAAADIDKAIALAPAKASFYLTRSGFHCFRWEAGKAAGDLKLAKRDEARVLQLGGKLERPCGNP